MKYLSYVLRNARRNPIRSLLTIGSLAVCGFLTMILLSLIAINEEVGIASRPYNRTITMSSGGFAQPVPIALLQQILQIDEAGPRAIETTPEGKPAISPFSWFGGTYGNDTIPFAQFGIDPETFWSIYPELTIPDDQRAAFVQDKSGAVIGRKLAEDKGLKIGDPIPLKGDIYPIDLNLTIQGIYDGPQMQDLRSCYFHWAYLDESLKRSNQGRMGDNAGILMYKLKDSASIPILSNLVDEETRNSDTPTRTQSEEAFVAMFAEMSRDLWRYINWVGLAVAVTLVLICGVSMAMSMRERTTEVAVLKAIGFPSRLVLGLVLTEAVLIAGLGGLVGCLGTAALLRVVDLSFLFAGFMPFLYIPTWLALAGFAGSLVIGLISGILPALQASRLPVVDGLRRIV